MIGSRARQRYFDREFHEGLWRWFRALSAGTKRLVLAVLAVGALYAFSGGSTIVLWAAVAVAVLMLVMLKERPPLDTGLPSDEELRELDRLAADDEDDDGWGGDAELAAGNGHLLDEAPPIYSFEQTLAQLLTFVGRRVTVQVAAASNARAVGVLWGRLRRGISVGAEDEDVLFFRVGAEGGFYLARERFEQAEREDDLLGRPSLIVYCRGVMVSVLDDEDRTGAQHAARMRGAHGSRRRPE